MLTYDDFGGEGMRQVGALLARAHDVEKYLGIKPALMVPPGLLPEVPGLVSIAGYAVIRGDRLGVVVPC